MAGAAPGSASGSLGAGTTAHELSEGAVGVAGLAIQRAVAFALADDLNRKRNAADKTAGKPGRHAMLAEIFMLRLEAAARAAKEAANSSRFVPITLPTAKAS